MTLKHLEYFGVDIAVDAFEEDDENDGSVTTLIDRDVYTKSPFRISAVLNMGTFQAVFSDGYSHQKKDYKYQTYTYTKRRVQPKDFAGVLMEAELFFRQNREQGWQDMALRENEPSIYIDYVRGRNTLIRDFPFVFSPSASPLNGVLSSQQNGYLHGDGYTNVKFADGRWIAGPYFDADAEDDSTTPLIAHVKNTDMAWFSHITSELQYGSKHTNLLFLFRDFSLIGDDVLFVNPMVVSYTQFANSYP